MNVREAAVRIGISEDQVRKLCQLRRLQHRRIGARSGKIEITEAHIEAYLESCEVKPVSPAEPEIERPRRAKPVVPDILGKIARMKG